MKKQIMTDSNLLTTIKDNGVATITLNRADIHNAFDDQLIKQLTQSIQSLDDDAQVRIIVLAAEGKSFSAGADLNWMKKMAGYDWEQNYRDSLQLAELMRTLHECKKTTIALVQGAAFGGGVGLIACCDIALASNTAKFCLSEVKLGLIPSVISPYVVKAIGERNAKRYFATAEIFDAAQANKMQLVSKIFTSESFGNETNSFINNMLNNSPQAMLQSKQLVNFVYNQPINKTIIEETAKRIANIRSSNEGKEGVSAFLEKRKANWINND